MNKLLKLTLAYTALIAILIPCAGCDFRLGLSPEEPPEPHKEWDERLKDWWDHQTDSTLIRWFFRADDACSNNQYQIGLLDSLKPLNITIRWYTSDNSILHTDAEYSYNKSTTIHHVLRDWNYTLPNDTTLIVDGVEYTKSTPTP